MNLEILFIYVGICTKYNGISFNFIKDFKSDAMSSFDIKDDEAIDKMKVAGITANVICLVVDQRGDYFNKAMHLSGLIKKYHKDSKTFLIGEVVESGPREIMESNEHIDFICQNHPVKVLSEYLNRVKKDGFTLNNNALSYIRGLGFRLGTKVLMNIKDMEDEHVGE